MSKYVSILDSDGYLMQKIYIEKIPIPAVSDNLYELCKEQIKMASKAKEIDRKIYELYGLTKEETDFINKLE